jgi:hypothetical protein
MKSVKPGVLAIIALIVVFLGAEICGGDELIEPTRKLGGIEKQWGGLTLFSEPPQMDVYMDGQKLGSTPLWLHRVEATQHVLQIGGVETSIQIKKGKTSRIGLFKGSLVKLPERDQRTVPSKTAKRQESRRTSSQQQPKHQKNEDLTLWERYINGSMKHF